MPGVRGLRDGVVKGLSDTGDERVKTLPRVHAAKRLLYCTSFSFHFNASGVVPKAMCCGGTAYVCTYMYLCVCMYCNYGIMYVFVSFHVLCVQCCHHSCC